MKMEVRVTPNEAERLYGDGIWGAVRSPLSPPTSSEDDIDLVCELLRRKTCTTSTRMQDDLREALQQTELVEECSSPTRTGVALEVEVTANEAERLHGDGIWGAVRSPRSPPTACEDDIDIVCELLSRKTHTTLTRLQDDLREALHHGSTEPVESPCSSPTRTGVAARCEAQLRELVQSKTILEDELRMLGARMSTQASTMQTTFDEMEKAAGEALLTRASLKESIEKHINEEEVSDGEEYSASYMLEVEEVMSREKERDDRSASTRENLTALQNRLEMLESMQMKLAVNAHNVKKMIADMAESYHNGDYDEEDEEVEEVEIEEKEDEEVAGKEAPVQVEAVAEKEEVEEQVAGKEATVQVEAIAEEEEEEQVAGKEAPVNVEAVAEEEEE
eukprot:CAMPEP_0198216466 /NCGR_PEP_ID=MMETSP1445-20131203/57618_1 /TAXON_ID=36898 /ORGANISM="Pyramimonas sp., Strain CCMP2087" /LENGTH=390 /DNA_ID=CAMNT_0043892707 /DNA_START=84 /DNA_END=1256 /DNA_ORIENTATION=-